jgi:hypothetical protein
MTESLIAQLPALEATLAGSVHVFMDRWQAHCESRLPVAPEIVHFSHETCSDFKVEASYYLDRQGRIWIPPFNPGPYFPIAVSLPPGESHLATNSKWLDIGRDLARDMRARGLAQRVALPPGITDVRPWQWEGFRVDVLYTYMLDLPYDTSLMRPQIRRSIQKAGKHGYTCMRVTHMDDVYTCLAETQERQGFDLKISLDDLTAVQHVLGYDILRAYVAYAPDGTPAASTVEIHDPGGTAVGWLAGTRCAHLNSGVSQLLNNFILEDLSLHGATTYDFAGANIPSVAHSKLQWGARLNPFYTVEGGNVTDIARQVRRYWRFIRSR